MNVPVPNAELQHIVTSRHSTNVPPSHRTCLRKCVQICNTQWTGRPQINSKTACREDINNKSTPTPFKVDDSAKLEPQHLAPVSLSLYISQSQWLYETDKLTLSFSLSPHALATARKGSTGYLVYSLAPHPRNRPHMARVNHSALPIAIFSATRLDNEATMPIIENTPPIMAHN